MKLPVADFQPSAAANPVPSSLLQTKNNSEAKEAEPQNKSGLTLNTAAIN